MFCPSEKDCSEVMTLILTFTFVVCFNDLVSIPDDVTESTWI